jgi:hypothetical protein
MMIMQEEMASPATSPPPSARRSCARAAAEDPYSNPATVPPGMHDHPPSQALDVGFKTRFTVTAPNEIVTAHPPEREQSRGREYGDPSERVADCLEG